MNNSLKGFFKVIGEVEQGYIAEEKIAAYKNIWNTCFDNLAQNKFEQIQFNFPEDWTETEKQYLRGLVFNIGEYSSLDMTETLDLGLVTIDISGLDSLQLEIQKILEPYFWYARDQRTA